MTLGDVASTLEDRGIVWQGVGFALFGGSSVALLWVYSDVDHWSIEVYRIAAINFNWTFAPAIALIIGRIRKMFETKAQIVSEARKKLVEKGRKQGLKEGRKVGVEEGRRVGVEEGRKLGVNEGRRVGVEEGRQEGERETLARVKSDLRKHGIQLTPEAENEIFNGHRHK